MFRIEQRIKIHQNIMVSLLLSLVLGFYSPIIFVQVSIDNEMFDISQTPLCGFCSGRDLKNQWMETIEY